MIVLLLRLLVLLMIALASPAWAALSRAELDTVRAAPPPAARVPFDVPLHDLDGRVVTLGQATLGRPSLLILSDWRCTQLCGSLLGIAAQSLSSTGLKPNTDFSLLVVGFDPDADARDGAALRDGAIGAYPEFRDVARILTGAPPAIARLEAAVGFTAVRDQDAGRYAHPADLYVLTADGRVSRVLNGLSLDPDTLRLAIVEAGQGRVGSLIDRLHVLCYGLDPLSGAWTGTAQTMLRVGATLTLAIGAGLLALVIRRRAARRA